jgi:hypothetical protein
MPDLVVLSDVLMKFIDKSTYSLPARLGGTERCGALT